MSGLAVLDQFVLSFTAAKIASRAYLPAMVFTNLVALETAIANLDHNRKKPGRSWGIAVQTPRKDSIIYNISDLQ